MQSAVKLDDYRNSKLQTEKGFIDFISDAEKDGSIENLTEFKNLVFNSNVNDLSIFFSKLGYSVPFDECKKIIENKEIVEKYVNNTYAY